MIAAPFVFFIIWTIISYHKYGISIGTYVLFLYTLTSFCAILIGYYNLYDNRSVEESDLGIIAPILYITLLFICIKPLYNLGNFNIIPPNKRTIRVLKLLSIVYLSIFIVVLIVAYQRIIFVLTSESLANIRDEQYKGDAVSFYNHLTGFQRYFCAILSILSPSAFIMLPISLYLFAFSKCKLYYKIGAFIGSFTPLIISINIADRSQYFYWLIMLGFSIVVFFKYLSKKKKFIILFFLSIILIGVLSYFIAVTNSRFGERDGGSIGGIILYAGEPYLNFCRFIYELNPPTTANIIFPNITTYIFDGDSYFELAHKIEDKQNTAICVFATFIGIIYSVSGGIVTLIFIIFYCITFYKLQTKIAHKSINLSLLIKLWCISIIPSIGIITYFYLNSGATTALFIWLIISYLLKKYESIKYRTTPERNRR